MKTQSSWVCAFAIFISMLLAIPAELYAAPQTGVQRAGEVSRVIPAVSISRNSKSITASPKTVVDWQDLVNTQANARARIALDDGSVLNVGSESSMRIVKHDSSAQQTELDLTYGKLRTQAQKIAKPDGKFEVRTPAGVAGVVGTDFFVGFDNATGTMNVIAFEGIVRVCNLAGVCVMVKAGQMTSVRSGDNSAPLAPTQATLDILTASVQGTDLGSKAGAGVLQGAAAGGSHIGVGTGIAIGIIAIVPAVVVPIVATHGSNNPTQVGKITNGCPNPNNPQCG